MMDFTDNIDALIAHLDVAQVEVQVKMAEASLRVATEARQLAIAGVNAGVYDTPEGWYQRTEKLLGGVRAEGFVSGGAAVVVVYNTTEYASDVEFGELPGGEPALDEESARAQADALGGEREVLYLGRSAAEWRKPNPAHLRAAMYAGFRLQEELRHVMKIALI